MHTTRHLKKKAFAPISFPPEYDHRRGNTDFESPVADTTLAGLRDNLAENRGTKPTDYNLLRLIQDENTDIKDQQEEAIKTHPDWVKQKHVMQVAKHFFSNSKNKDAQEITLSTFPLKERSLVAQVGEVVGAEEKVVITRDEFTQHYSDTRAFENALNKNRLAADALVEISTGSLPNIEAKTELKNYLGRQKQRWNVKEELAKTDEDKATARTNEEIFSFFIDDLDTRLKPLEKKEQDRREIEQKIGEEIRESEIGKGIVEEEERTTQEATERLITSAQDITKESSILLDEADKTVNNVQVANRTAEEAVMEDAVVMDAVDIVNHASKKLTSKGGPKRRLFYRKKN